MSLALVLVVVGVPAGLAGAGLISVALIRWARRNRARAAQMMLGSYLQDQVEGGPIDGQAGGGWLDNLSDWLGECVDSVSGYSDSGGDSGFDGGHHGGYDGGHHGDSGGSGE